MIEVLEKIGETYKGADLLLCEKAYRFARKAHENQKRASGEEYFTHPCNVAKILIDLGMDAATIAERALALLPKLHSFPQPLRAVSVAATRLSDDSVTQLSLFDSSEEEKNLEKSIDRRRSQIKSCFIGAFACLLQLWHYT